MKKYCSVCFREISTSSKGRICRHGFKKNRWVFNDGTPEIEDSGYIRVDGSPCSGSGRYGLTLKQVETRKK